MPLSNITKLHIAVFHDVITPRLNDDKKIREEAAHMELQAVYNQDQLDEFVNNLSLKIVDEIAEYLKASSLYEKANRFRVTPESYARVGYHVDVIEALEDRVKELYPSPIEQLSLAQRVANYALSILNTFG